MGLFNWFKKEKPQVAELPIQAEIETVEKGKVLITYGTGMPIDLIYDIISTDHEKEGYDDALTNSSIEYCKAKESLILNGLLQKFEQVKLKYENDIRVLTVKIENAKALMAPYAGAILEAKKAVCADHLDKIMEMKHRVDQKAPELMTMIDSYHRGFIRGCAAQRTDLSETKEN